MNTTDSKFLYFYRSRPAHLHRPVPAFSLFELLVAIVIIATAAGIMMPVLKNARDKARAVRTMSNQRQIVIAVTSYAADNGRYPPSVANVGSSQETWNWQEPTILTSSAAPDIRKYRSVSAYLRSYIDDARAMFCPNAPKQYKYLAESWEAGDDWNNPDTPHDQDPVVGTYCFYWNYVGFIEGRDEVFIGPQNLSVEKEQSKLLVSDYFGYGHWRNKFLYGSTNAYGCCEKFKSAAVTPGTSVSSDFWSYPDVDGITLDTLQVELHAAFTDGHVETYTPAETIPMQVSITPDGGTPYPARMGPGIFYLPKLALD